MSLSHSIAKNTAWQAAGKIIGITLSLVVASLVFRHLGANGVGQYTMVIAFLQIFGILMDFGFYIILIKTLANVTPSSQTEVNNIFTLRLISGVIFLGMAPLVAVLVSRFNHLYSTTVIQGITLTTLFFFFVSLTQLLSAIFQKFLRTNWIALAELTGKIVLLASTVVVIALRGSLLSILFTLVLASGVNFLINLISSRRYLKIRLQLNAAIVKKILRRAWPIALSIGFTLLYFKGDVIILTFFEKNPAVIGWYGAPYKLLEVLITFPAMFAGLVLPLLTSAWQNHQQQQFTQFMQKSFDAIIIVVAPLIAGTLVLAPQIIQVVAGNEFASSINILRVLIFAVGAIFFGTLFGYLVVALDKQRQMLWAYGFVAITSLAGYLFFIPRYSIMGAAVVTVYSETMVMLIAMYIARRATQVKWRFAVAGKAVVSAILMFTLLVVIKAVGDNLLFNNGIGNWGLFNFSATAQAITKLAIYVPLGVMVYFIFLISLRGVTLQEIRELILAKK